ncbi:MAG: hypothetical protein ACQEQM_05110 [Thermoplasmatota archaeon]
MKLWAIVVVTIIAVAAAAVGGLYFYMQSLKEDSYMSEYNFEVSFDTTEVQEDLIVYTPLPTKDGSPFVSESEFLEDSNIPEGWSCEFVDTEYGVMLKVRIERLEVGQYDDLFLRVDSESSIDTKNALDEESILNPVHNLVEDEYDDEPYPERYEDQMKYYVYDSYVYVENLTEGSELNVYVHQMGTNGWWVFGWNGNEYRNRLRTSSITTDGWHEVETDLIQGWGNY